MRRTTKVKIAVARVPLRQAATPTVVAPAAPRRAFPAWIDANERSVAPVVTAKSATSRVRDGLVLRIVGLKKSAHVRKPSHGAGAR